MGASSLKACILLLILFPHKPEACFLFCPLQHWALKRGGGWIERGRGGWGIRAVNNPLHSVRANKNANAQGRRDAIVRRGSSEVSGSLFFLHLFFHSLSRLCYRLLFSSLPLEVMGQIRPKVERPYRAAQTWCWESVIHYRWQHCRGYLRVATAEQTLP